MLIRYEKSTVMKKSKGLGIMPEKVWDGTEEEFVKLVQWAMVFRKLAKKRTPGWLETALNQFYVEKLAEMYGYTEDAVVEMMKSIKNTSQPDESMLKALSRSFEESIENMMDRGMPLFCKENADTE